MSGSLVYCMAILLRHEVGTSTKAERNGKLKIQAIMT